MMHWEVEADSDVQPAPPAPPSSTPVGFLPLPSPAQLCGVTVLLAVLLEESFRIDRLLKPMCDQSGVGSSHPRR